MNILAISVILLVIFHINIASTKLIVNQTNGKPFETINLNINSDTQHIITYTVKDSLNPLRVNAWTKNAKLDNPVFIVVHQEREVLSWQVPFEVETKKYEKLQFSNTSRTLCYNHIEDVSKGIYDLKNLSQSVIVEVMTTSTESVDINLMVEEVNTFYIENNIEYLQDVSFSQSKFFFYKFSTNSSRFEKSIIQKVLITIKSEDDVCLVVSVQNNKCPVFAQDIDITYRGKYQTINKNGALTIKRKEFPDGFFLVFVAKPDNFDCSDEKSALPSPGGSHKIESNNRTSLIRFTINKTAYGNDYGEITFLTLAVIAGLYFSCFLLECIFTKFGKIHKIDDPNPNDSTQQFGFTIMNNLPRNVESASLDEVDALLMSKKLPVNLLSQYPEVDNKRSFNYLWHILSTALFYGIPVIQLVITYQRTVNQTGNQDMCYYNFLCSNPAWGMSDFNHIFSNIGYIFFGLLFILVCLHRSTLIKRNLKIGIPAHFGLFYAMGVALIIEGVLSASYHFCPSQSSFQFDTSFMYIMAVFCMMKLYQNRHPDIHATSYATFSFLGLTIFLAMVGILNGDFAVGLVFVIVYTILTIYISLKIYFLGYVINGFNNFRNQLKEDSKINSFKPIRMSRFIILVIVNVLNYLMLIGGMFMYSSGVTDFGTFILGVLMANAFLHTIFYTAMKLINNERLCIEAILYGILMIVSWIGSAYFFLDSSTQWTVTPAESRQLNQNCVLMNFYDKHDVWHLFSAPALYFSFKYLLCIDDDLFYKKQSEIAVF